MFLKRLELAGFKSFADLVHVEFEEGVTAVVGPNGSGKSNISDAVRWVLGEQSARNLRGSKMEDVIFSGSETRPALNMAEISLILNNEQQKLAVDYTEVAVTRRVFRTGDSEYLINGQSCRLKDIIDLFMDSGIGRESFSIIGQGRVEEILSSKAEDRRAIFEEAAGVRKYKQRKQQAEKKLMDTEENLKRVRDILHELEAQVQPLEEQASAAREYLAQKEELKQIEAAVLVYEVKEKHEEWTAEKERLEEIESRKARLVSKVSKIEEKQMSGRKLLKTLDKKVEQNQQDLLDISQEVEKQEGLKELWKERKKHYSQNRLQYRREIEVLQEKRNALDESLKQEERVLKETVSVLENTKTELRDVQEKLSVLGESKEQQLEELKSQYIDLLNEKTSLDNERRYTEEQMIKAEEYLNRRERENADVLKQRQAFEQKMHDKENKYKAAKEKVENITNRWYEKKNAFERLLRQNEDKESLYYEGLRHLQQMEAKRDTLESMQQEYTGFFTGVKHILKERDRDFSGVRGAVAELISVPEKLGTALETALGASQQHVVVENEAAGRKAIQYLKSKNLGRATFLPLDTVKSRFISETDLDKVRTFDAFTGVASELVETEDKYRHVMRHLLGNVLIASNLQSAESLAKAVYYRYRIVTLEGDILNPGGSMTGGSLHKKQTQLLGRQKELESLKVKISSMTEKTTELEAGVRAWKSKRKELENELQEIKQSGEENREKELRMKTALEEFRVTGSSLHEKLRLYDMETKETLEEQHNRKHKLQKLTKEVDDLNRKLESMDEKIHKLSENREKEETDKAHLVQRSTSLQIAYAKEEEQAANQRENLQRIRRDLKELSEEIAEKDEANSLLEAELNEKSSDASSVEDILAEKKAERSELNSKLKSLREKRTEQEKRLQEVEGELKESSNQNTYLQEQLHNRQLEVNRLDMELDQRLNHLQEEYELSFQAAEQQYYLSISLEEAQSKVRLLKMGLSELGEVNTGAIDEFARVKERFDFLHGQKEDLEEAKATLTDIIGEMDSEMVGRFEYTFNSIQHHFHSVFRELFGGGNAALELSNPEDLLHTGVDISAQPPGKKLQNLALLSGGERALTAIALLFSILKARPVPFCVLDEVEAALDEANVSRFAEFLKEFSCDTQFVVVTHRKGTMEKADALYGVTMQESGISNLVSVKLEESKELVGTGSSKEE
ncbi:MAG: chromosome segregation protein SMC [Alkalicoccus sp.]|nr:MAG: chromosome segregation protein SMC [Alkalicoccus sp.]